MAVDRAALRQHLEHLAQAYGADLALPRAAAVEFDRAVAADAAPGRQADPGEAPLPRAAAAAPPAPPPVPAVRADAPAAPAPPAEHETAAAALQALRAEVSPCTRCKLHQGRTQTVFGEGHARPDVVFVGEAPGAREDQTGRPFVGPAGQLLDRILSGAMGLQRTDVYIANVNKCRPPGNRNPEPDEVAACLPFLHRQLEILRPRVIVCLGRVAAHNLLGTNEPMRALRGRDLAHDGTPVVVTWHPAYLLRDPSHKRETWEDIKRVNRLLGRPEVPGPANG